MIRYPDTDEINQSTRSAGSVFRTAWCHGSSTAFISTFFVWPMLAPDLEQCLLLD